MFKVPIDIKNKDRALLHTYTFIMEYLGGCYISQVEAPDEREAMYVWIRELKVKEIDGFTPRDQANLIDSNIRDEEPALITGTKNVWCIGVKTRKGFGLVNFVKTDSAE